MLVKLLKRLDAWIEKYNEEAQEIGIPKINGIGIYVIGQTALVEADLSIEIAATMDVDLKYQLDHRVKQKLEELLSEPGKHLDPVGHEAWMPEETEYRLLYNGSKIKGYIAEPVFIILSKAKYAPEKNRQLIVDYLASSDLDQQIFDLAEKYEVDLEKFV